MTTATGRQSRAAWSGSELEEIRQLAAAGQNSTQIGKRYGVTRAAIIGLCHRKGIKLPGANGRGKALDPASVKVLIQEYRQGKSQRKIAAGLGVSQGCVAKIVKRHALKRQPRPALKLPQAPRPPRRRSRVVPDKRRHIDPFAEGFEGQTGSKSFADLDRHDCRFPIDQTDGEVRYCGKRSREESSYCDEHFARCTRPWVRRPRGGAG